MTTKASTSALLGPENPFARKAIGSQSTSLKKTGSFFDRVDASNSIPTSTSTSVSGSSGAASKQSTLFGLPAASKDVKDKSSNRGRKRKSDSGAHSEEGESRGDSGMADSRKEPKRLASFFRKEIPTSSAYQERVGEGINDESELNLEVSSTLRWCRGSMLADFVSCPFPTGIH